MQRDCNFVLYESFGPQKKPLWASKTYKRGVGCFLIMQEDCNLVVYDQDWNPLWSSGTHDDGGVPPCALHGRYYSSGSAVSPVLSVLDSEGNDLWDAYKGSGN
ncbi:hypothetical protein Mapa_007279 [Marchantia paleacea]|nr:hypothetical protein Mapa_007279 [Marchantia paleacea]